MGPVIDDTSRLRIPEDVLSQDLEGETVLLNLASGIYFGLDSIGTRIWRLIEEHGRLEPIRGAMAQEYEVSDERLGEDLIDLVAQLLDKGLLEVVKKGKGSGTASAG